MFMLRLNGDIFMFRLHGDMFRSHGDMFMFRLHKKNFHICFMVTCSCSDCMVTYSCFMVTCSCSDCIVTCSLCGATYIILYKGIKLHATVLHTHTQQSITVHCFYILYLQGYRDWLLIGFCREVLVFLSY